MKRSALPLVRGVKGRVYRWRRPAVRQRALKAREREHPPGVGQHAADLDAEMLVVGERGGEKRGGTGGRLVGVDLGEGHAGMVIHADMDVFPAGAWTGVAAVVGHVVAGAAKPAEFLDIEVQQVAGMRMFVAANGRRRVAGGQSLESGAAEDATDGGGRHMYRGGDVGATPAAPAQRHDLGRDRRRQCRGWRCGRELRSRNPSAPSA